MEVKKTNRADYIDENLYQRIRREIPYDIRLVCDTAVETGLRISDVLALQPCDLVTASQSKGFVQVVEQKTSKARTVHISTQLLQRLLLRCSSDWVFPSPKKEGTHRTRQSVWWWLHKFKCYGVVSPHSLRKRYAVELLKRTKDLKKVQRALQHENLETTIIYAYADKLKGD